MAVTDGNIQTAEQWLQLAGFAVVTPTLTTLVTRSLLSDGVDGSDVEVVPTEPRKEVTATTLVTSVTPPVVSKAISKCSGLWMAISECVYWTELMHWEKSPMHMGRLVFLPRLRN